VSQAWLRLQGPSCDGGGARGSSYGAQLSVGDGAKVARRRRVARYVAVRFDREREHEKASI
jgi:hypothetical protein